MNTNSTPRLSAPLLPDSHMPDYHMPDSHRSDLSISDHHMTDSHRSDPSISDHHMTDSHRSDPSISDPNSSGHQFPDPDTQSSQNCTEAQRELAGMIRAFIMSNLDRHITIRELSETLHVSPTQVKACFRKVYGLPIYTYGRQQRIKVAVQLLCDTDLSILEIAGRCGYENGSKFSAAFRKVTGETPARYRRRLRFSES